MALWSCYPLKVAALWRSLSCGECGEAGHQQSEDSAYGFIAASLIRLAWGSLANMRHVKAVKRNSVCLLWRRSTAAIIRFSSSMRWPGGMFLWLGVVVVIVARLQSGKQGCASGWASRSARHALDAALWHRRRLVGRAVKYTFSGQVMIDAGAGRGPMELQCGQANRAVDRSLHSNRATVQEICSFEGD